jgi:hypothetical protein
MRKQNKQALLYITEPVYRAYHTNLSSKDLCVFLFPATTDEIDKVSEVERSEVFDILIRMPQWWISWYYSLTLEERYKFAKIIEQRLKEYKLI